MKKIEEINIQDIMDSRNTTEEHILWLIQAIADRLNQIIKRINQNEK